MYVVAFLDRQLPVCASCTTSVTGDIALSANQNQPHRHGDTVLGREFAREPMPVRSIALWQRTNLAAAAHGEAMGERYLRIRFEDLCAFSDETIARILGFCELGAPPPRLALRLRPLVPERRVGAVANAFQRERP